MTTINHFGPHHGYGTLDHLAEILVYERGEVDEATLIAAWEEYGPDNLWNVIVGPALDRLGDIAQPAPKPGLRFYADVYDADAGFYVFDERDAGCQAGGPYESLQAAQSAADAMNKETP